MRKFGALQWLALAGALVAGAVAAHAQTTQQPQPQLQGPPLTAPLPQLQSGVANLADPVVPVFIVRSEGHVYRLGSAGYVYDFSGLDFRVGGAVQFPERDHDGDGVAAVSHGGTDCDDNDADRAPGLQEVSDLNGHDEDCDYTTIGNRDWDEDGFVSWSASNIIRDGSGRVIVVVRGPDCDDVRRDVNPNSPEVLGDLSDNNCDGLIDAFDHRGHSAYCAPTWEIRASQALSPCGRPRGDTSQFDR